MRELHQRYLCFPSVIRVGKETEITVKPRDISRVFRPDREYSLYIVGLRDDMPDYRNYQKQPLAFEIKEGCLVFSHTFDSEQEYSVRFCEKDKREVRLSVYAVNDDLFALRPLKGDFHSHSYYSDGEDGFAMTPADYREEGFDFFALTDHNRMYTSVLAARLYDGVNIGINIMNGEEVHTPGSVLHIVNAGGKNSVCDRYINDFESYEREVDLIEQGLSHVPEKYRHRTAMAKWACEEIRKQGGLAVFAHPFWQPNAYNVSAEFCDILFEEKIFDAFELVGGCGYKANNLQLALWQQQTLKGNILPIVGSSDSHNHNYSKTVFARCFSIVFAKDNTTDSILEAVKSGLCVAAEIPRSDDNEIRFYSDNLRLVLFAHFLHTNYFNETYKLCVGEGNLMRRYAEGEETGELLSGLKDTVKRFYEQFYGFVPCGGITAQRQRLLDEGLELQRKVGPETLGSHIKFYGNNQRRE